MSKETVAPKVSILIPVFNRQKFIAECIQSALDQTYSDFEVVVVDNASDDGTWEICQRFSDLDQRVRLFRNDTNIGPVRNWKRCVEEAMGEFCKILFSDDLLEPDCLSEMAPILEDPNIGLVYCAAWIGKSKEEAKLVYSIGEQAQLSFTNFMNLLLRGQAPVSPGAALMRTADLKANLHTNFPTATPRPFEKHGAGPDVMSLILTAENYPFVYHLPVPLVFFRAHSGSFTSGIMNSQVNKGYISAFSYYLRLRFGLKPLTRYLASCWLKEMKIRRRWINPKKLLVEYQGTGSVGEILSTIVYSVRQPDPIADGWIRDVHESP